MILRVFRQVGDRLSVAEAYRRLTSLCAKDPYANKKAAGSLGGAVNGGTIFLDDRGDYERIR
ncbi:MAG: hypothetical protein RR320_01520 [Oscillospiraceae bacterium]